MATKYRGDLLSCSHRRLAHLQLVSFLEKNDKANSRSLFSMLVIVEVNLLSPFALALVRYSGTSGAHCSCKYCCNWKFGHKALGLVKKNQFSCRLTNNRRALPRPQEFLLALHFVISTFHIAHRDTWHPWNKVKRLHFTFKQTGILSCYCLLAPFFQQLIPRACIWTAYWGAMTSRSLNRDSHRCGPNYSASNGISLKESQLDCCSPTQKKWIKRKMQREKYLLCGTISL